LVLDSLSRTAPLVLVQGILPIILVEDALLFHREILGFTLYNGGGD